MARRDRAISTVVDVGMALILVTASIGVVAVFLEDDGPATDPQKADEMVETLAGTTMDVEYSLEPIEDEPEFENDDYDESAFQRSRFGATTSMIARSAVVDVTIEDQQLTDEGEQFSSAVRGNTLNSLTAMDGNARITAIYRPYPDSTVRSKKVIGPEPPGDADVSTVTMRVSTDIPRATDDELADAYGPDHDYDAAGTLVAERIVEGYFPPEDTQRALESERFERALVVYRYLRMADITEAEYDPDFDPDDSSNPVSREGANVTEANARLVEGLGDIVAEDMEDSFDDPPSAEFAEEVSTDSVTITVQTWKHEED